MNKTSVLIGMAALVFATGIQTARALTTSMTPAADTYLRNEGSADLNFGGMSPLLVGVAKEPFTIQNRALFKFDLAGIPTNATITNVTLQTVLTRALTDECDADLNRMLVDWGENEATWNDRFTSIPWQAGGCQSGTDYVSAPSVTAIIDGGTFNSAGMVADVQLWLKTPGTNYGWMLHATGDLNGTGKQIGSRESDFTPVLTVDYTLSPPTTATPPTIFGTALVGNQFRFSFNAESNRVYAVEFRDSLAVTNWNVLTNIPAEPLNRIINLTNPVSSTERYFRARTP